MDALKRQRKALRTVFTKAHTAFLTKIASNDSTKEEKTVAFQFLEAKMAELDSVHAKLSDALFSSEVSEDELTKKLESNDSYQTNYLTAKVKMEEAFTTTAPPVNVVTVSNVRNAPPTVSTTKLPRIELPKFNGSVKEWLPFWSQFKKISDDKTLTKADKFQYLLQASVPGSRAHELVSSFPPTEENYEEVITCLKNRFGRDDIVVEFYVRELLGLVLQNAMSNGKKASLSSLYDKVESNIRALNTLGVTTDKCAAMLYPLVESSLPEHVLRAWQRNGHREENQEAENNGERGNKDRLTQLLEFVRKEVENEERIDMALSGFKVSSDQDATKKNKGKSEPTKNVPSATALLTAKDDRVVICIFCKGKHDSLSCETARKLSLDERRDIVKRENVCFRCLRRGHISKKCRVNVKCEWCGNRHVLLMCSAFHNKDSVHTGGGEVTLNSVVKASCDNNMTAFCAFPEVCLQTIRVKVFSENREETIRVLIDTGSQRSYIRSQIAREVGYDSVGQQEITHSLFGGVKSKCAKHDTFLVRLKSIDNGYKCNFFALGQETICDTIPSAKHEQWVDDLRKRGIILSDIGGEKKPIDVLIGADVAGKLMTGKKVDLKNGLIAFETCLGWTVMGKLPATYGKTDTANMIVSMHVREASLSDLWHLDVLGIADPIQRLEKSVKDDKVREFLIQTATLTDEGRYKVKLPWVEDHAPLVTNYDVAQQRLNKGIEKLKRENLYDLYDRVFGEWLKEGIIERVLDEGEGPQCHYLPHRPVIKPHSTTTIRPVFDASACKKGYPSLNNCLEKGPNLIEQIPALLNRFRQEKIGIVSDIRKAFLQIGIDETDRDSLRFLWVLEDKVIIFRHCRVVFGLACSPFLLAAVLELHLNKLLLACRQNEDVTWSKNTIERLKFSFYVDNCVASVSSRSELECFVRESIDVMAAGGFDLRGWESSGDSNTQERTSVLGISWNKSKDTLSINPSILDIKIPGKITKRVILSATNKIFDPVGVTCPVVLQSKILLQKLCEEKIGWDTEIKDSLKNEFIKWLSDIPLLKHVEVRRPIGDGNLSLHAFGDASGSAYATVIFARVENEDGVTVTLLSARSRIAPKQATIPRLELMAAAITARLASTTASSLTRPILKTVFWLDSTTALAWIKRDMQWGTFVWNRVREIRSLSKKDDWRYVPTDLNPADLPSRGCSAARLIESEWWSGPSWLHRPEAEWPEVKREVDETTVSSEVKKTVLIPLVSLDGAGFKVRDYFSSYTKLIRFLAWMNRFLTNRRVELMNKKSRLSKEKRNFESVYLSQDERRKLHLTHGEIEDAEKKLLRHLQRNMFDTTTNNKLSSFKTMVNEDGLRVLKTKIFNRVDNYNFLCPILLDNDNEIVYLLVRETHERVGHAGALIIMSNLRERFWIISLRKVIRSVLSKCVTCKRHKVKQMQCEPPPLPSHRVRDAAIFETVGVDFAGPLFLREGGKAWICIFTCAVYRAVHFELATSLSVEGFLECLRRFVARRGRPLRIVSDNGTNFVGTRNVFNKLNWGKIMKHSSASQIEWFFNPPSAPWWGGWWERLIGVLKTILRKVLGKASLSYESLMTILCDAEAIMNSRPLTYVSENHDDLKPLSPSDFLKEIREIGVPDCDMLCHLKLNKRLRYRQKIIDDLRARFRVEYLGQLLLKEGKKESRKVKVGDVVLIGDDIHKRIDWPLARVVDEIPGRDGKTRVFMLKTKNGVMKRPLQRIYPLEISVSEQIVSDLKEKASFKEIKNVRVKNDDLEEKDLSESSERSIVIGESDHTEPVTTRSGRQIKRPVRYNPV